MIVKLYDCTYRDARGNRRIWVCPAENAFKVRLQFDELVGEGEVISIRETPEFYF